MGERNSQQEGWKYERSSAQGPPGTGTPIEVLHVHGRETTLQNKEYEHGKCIFWPLTMPGRQGGMINCGIPWH